MPSGNLSKKHRFNLMAFNPGHMVVKESYCSRIVVFWQNDSTMKDI